MLSASGELFEVGTESQPRSISAENPRGEKGGGGQTGGGRKGSPALWLEPHQTETIAEIDGPAVVRHIWVTIPPAPPDIMRALQLDAYYDGEAFPSISVPLLDFFGAAHGRPVAYSSAVNACHEGRGFNTFIPMPVRRHLSLRVSNHADVKMRFYFEVDYTLEPSLPEDAGLLHVSYRRENPTVMRSDFTILPRLLGPGRFLGCVVGVRPIDDGTWYGEGEVKMYLDGDDAYPTICGTGLEDYAGTAWSMGPHAAPYGGAPLVVPRPTGERMPEFVTFYRWHVLDPIHFAHDCRVTIQQIGAARFDDGQEAEFEAYQHAHPPAGRGWWAVPDRGILGTGIVERVDDFCATAFAYAKDAQAVPLLSLEDALGDIERRPFETPDPDEARLAALLGF